MEFLGMQLIYWLFWIRMEGDMEAGVGIEPALTALQAAA